MSDFVARYGGVYEHSKWVAQEAEPIVGIGAGTEQIAEAMRHCVDRASIDRQLVLIKAHPDLAGRAAVAGALTEDSSEEQARAGLDRCTRDEFDRLQELNAAYRRRFGFPFVMAVRNSSRRDILETFETRLGNDYDTEFDTALQEIHKIARLRLTAMEVE